MHYKKINSEYFYTILDRLTRFEPAKVKFERVLGDILNKFYLEKKSDLSIEEKINIVNEIIDFSCEKENGRYNKTNDNTKNEEKEAALFEDAGLSLRPHPLSFHQQKRPCGG